MSARIRILLALAAISAWPKLAGAAESPPLQPATLQVCGSRIEVTFDPGHLDASREEVLAWISRAACAVTTYFGRFPVAKFRVEVLPVAGAEGVLGGTTWGFGGAHSRIQVGEHAGRAALERDWVMTHELVHVCFPQMDEEHHWIEEGLATYVEPLARSWTGSYPPEQVWADLVDGLPKGMPATGDHGLDRTHTWGRTYWGGAMFALLADVEIHRRTRGKHGLRDALQAILAAGGNHEAEWTIAKAFEVGDRAVGVPVLEELYAKMKDKPASPDLEHLWKQLGVSSSGGKVSFDASAPEAELRRAISERPKQLPACACPAP